MSHIFIGEWEGDGWIEFGASQRHTFRQKEKEAKRFRILAWRATGDSVDADATVNVA